MRRGEIWWVEFGERRPVVLLSEDEPSGFRAMQVVAPADTDISGWGIEVAVGVPEGLPFDGVLRFAFRRPGSARLRIPSVGGLRQTEKERTPTLTKVDLVRTTDGPRRLSNKITIYGWSTRHAEGTKSAKDIMKSPPTGGKMPVEMVFH